MADSKISDLTALTTPANDDVFAVVDTDAGQTKKITFANLNAATSASVAADDISTGDAAVTIATSTGDITIDAPGDIILDADDGDIQFKNGGTLFGSVNSDASSPQAMRIQAHASNGDIIFKGNDDGSTITALTLDMSEAGKATFNNHVVVSDRVIGSSNLILNTVDSNEKIHMDAGGFIKFESDGVEAMRIDSSQRVGIGTSSPSQLLEVQKDQNTDTSIKINNQTGGSAARASLFLDANSGGLQLMAIDDGFTTSGVYQADAGLLATDTALSYGLNLATRSSDSNAHMRLYTQDTERMRISSSGNIGIGTTSPSSKLDIRGTGAVSLNVGSTDGTTARLTLDATNGDASGGDFPLLLSDGTSLSIEVNNSGSNAFMTFATNASEKMRIDSSGNVLVGKTASDIGTDGIELGTRIESTTDGSYALRLNRKNSDGDITQFRKDGASIGSIGVSSSDFVFTSAVSDKDILFKGSDGGSAITALTLDMSVGGQLLGVANTSTNPTYSFAGDSNTGMTRPTSDTLQFVTGGSERVRIDSSGRVGIGASSPTTAFTVYNSSNPQFTFGYNADQSHQLSWDSSTVAINVDPNNDGSNSSFAVNVDGSERMRIDSSGNVGIGISSPLHQLHVRSSGNGKVRFDGNTNSNTSDLLISHITSGDAGLQFDSNQLNMFAYGDIAFFPSTSNISGSYPNGQSVVFKNTGKVGIGETSPLGQLHVKTADSGASAHASADELVIEGSANAGINILSGNSNEGGIYFGDDGDNDIGRVRYDHSANSLDFFVNASERMTIDSSGNVGIGESSPKEKLDVSGAGVFTGNHATSANAYGAAQGVMIHATGSTGFVTAVSNGSNDVDLQLRALNGGSANANQLVLDSEGNIGVGTSSPEQPLHIKSTAGVRMERFQAGSGGANIDIRKSRNATVGSHTILQNGDAIGGLIFRGSDGAEYENAAAILAFVGGNPGTNDMPGMLSFYTTADGANSYTERMRIESTGQVAVLRSGQSSFFDTSHKIVGELPSDSYAFLATQNATAGAGPHYFSKFFANGQNLLGSITVSNTATAFNTSSDYRLKENVNYDFDATSRLKQLKPARFNFIADADTTVDGFLAHEVSDIVPEAISGDKDETETKTKVVVNSSGFVIRQDVEEADWIAGKVADEDGKTEYPTDSTWEASKVVPVYQGIDQSKLVPLLVKTIQELEARITNLENN